MIRRWWVLVPLLALALGLLPTSAEGFHAPPWDTGHQSFRPDSGDDDTDPGDGGPCKSGSPVDLASGNMVYAVRDLLVGGFGPALDLTRTYNSRDMRRGPIGNGWVFPYDQRLVEASDGVQVFAICTDGDGRRERYTRLPDGTYIPPPHVRSTLSRNSDGTYVVQDKHGLRRVFGADGRLDAIIDRNGNALTLHYDATGFLETITDKSGRTLRFTKGPSGRIAGVTDPADRLFRYEHDAAGNLVRAIDPLGQTTTYAYDAESNLTAITDPAGRTVLTATYDARGRVVTMARGAATWAFAYLTNPNRTTARNAINSTWTYFYDDSGSITRITDPLGNSESYAYDANRNLISLTDKKGAITTFTYDGRGNPLTTVDAAGKTRQLTYEPSFSLPLTVRDRNGGITTFAYDARGNLIRSTNPAGGVTDFEYDSHGQLRRLVDPMRRAQEFDYDGHGYLLRTRGAVRGDASASYDVLGQLEATADENRQRTEYHYDLNQRLVRTVNPLGGTVLNEYDLAGNIVAVTAASGARTLFAYDNSNRLTLVTEPGNRTTAFTYDHNNNVLTKRNANGQTIQFTYDVLGRLTRKTTTDDVVSFTYDGNGNLTTAVDNDSRLTFSHDNLSRIVQAGTGPSIAQPTTTLAFTYDADGNRLTLTDPTGTATYGYDEEQRVVQMRDPVGDSIGFRYDAGSSLTEITRPGGLQTRFTYDGAARLQRLEHSLGVGVPLVFDHTYDAASRRESITDAAGTHAYRYDSLSRLLGVTHSGGPAEAYSYDAVGNRLSSHLSPQYQHDAGNRLLSDSQFTYEYDSVGNLVRKRSGAGVIVGTYTYDVEGRLSRFDAAGVAATYRYDALGRRIEKNVNGVVTRYVYDAQDILLEYNASGALLARYTHGPAVDQVLAERRGSTYSTFETDALGSIVRVSNAGGVTATFSYDSFGRIISQNGGSSSPYRFQGREYDPESGLYYYRARYYDPAAGRFLSPDPLGFAGGLNFYTFARNNPVNLLDPFGLRPCPSDWLDGLQTLLDLAGLVPGFGEFFDLANAGIYGLRGDALNAGLSLGSAVPFLGWGSTAAKFGNKAVKAGVTEGIYEFVSTSGKKYVGQSGDIDRRLIEHIRSGKVSAEEAARAARSEVTGGKTAREIAEQRRIDELGGIQNLENKVNPIGPNRRHLLDK